MTSLRDQGLLEHSKFFMQGPETFSNKGYEPNRSFRNLKNIDTLDVSPAPSFNFERKSLIGSSKGSTTKRSFHAIIPRSTMLGELRNLSSSNSDRNISSNLNKSRKRRRGGVRKQAHKMIIQNSKNSQSLGKSDSSNFFQVEDREYLPNNNFSSIQITNLKHRITILEREITLKGTELKKKEKALEYNVKMKQ